MERGLLFLSTPFDEDSADLLDGLGMPAFKVPSGEVTNHPFVAHVASKGKPVLMSTGMSTLVEVAAAVQVVRESGDPPLALFHCVTSYPAAAGRLQPARDGGHAGGVRGSGRMERSHGGNPDISLAAVAAGAAVLEKHFTLDRTMPGPDHRASLEPGELSAMVRTIREVETAMGDGAKRPVRVGAGEHRRGTPQSSRQPDPASPATCSTKPT